MYKFHFISGGEYRQYNALDDNELLMGTLFVKNLSDYYIELIESEYFVEGDFINAVYHFVRNI